jgi:hypothetical protein
MKNSQYGKTLQLNLRFCSVIEIYYYLRPSVCDQMPRNFSWYGEQKSLGFFLYYV